MVDLKVVLLIKFKLWENSYWMSYYIKREMSWLNIGREEKPEKLLKKSQEDLAMLSHNYDLLSAKCKNLEARLAVKDSEFKDLDKKIVYYMNLAEKFEKENNLLKKLEPRNSIPKSLLNNSANANISIYQVSNLESQLQASNSALAKCQEELSSSNSKLDKCQEELRAYKNYIQRNQEEKLELQKKYDNHLNERESKLAEQKNEIKNNETQISQLEAKIFDLMEFYESSKKSANDLVSANTEFSRKISESKSKLEILESSVQEKNRKIELCEAEIRKYKEVIQQNLGSEIQRCNQVIESAARESKLAANTMLEYKMKKYENFGSINQEESENNKILALNLKKAQMENEILKEKLRTSLIRLE